MAKTKLKKICTVILEYQNPKMTLSTIKSLRKATLPLGYKHRIVIVDNSPVPDGTLAKELKPFPSIKLITTHKNTGFAAGNNLGIKRGLEKNADLFLLLNNDVKLHSKFLTRLVNTINQGADIAVPKIYFAKGYEYHQDKYKPHQLGKVLWYAGGNFDWDNVYSRHFGMDQVDKGQYNQPSSIELANFCCVLIKRQVFETIGLLDEKYFLYWEDGDFSVRAKRAGFNLVYQPRSRVWHKNSGSSGSGSSLHDYYLTRNRLLFGFRYAGLRTKLALIRECIRKIFSGRPGEKKGIQDFFLRRLGKGSFV